MDEKENQVWVGIDESHCFNCLDDSTILYPRYHAIRSIVNWLLVLILLIGIILGPCLIYRKHKGEKGLWKKIVKWELIFILIMFGLWFIISLIFWLFQPQGIIA